MSRHTSTHLSDAGAALLALSACCAMPVALAYVVVRAVVRRCPQPWLHATHISAVAIGDAFEETCADALSRHGWRVTRTGGSGDGGCDLLCTRGRTRLVVQCKGTRGVVGSRAVQEAHSGRGLHTAHLAAVVSPGLYTPQARLLAASLDVDLLAPSELGSL